MSLTGYARVCGLQSGGGKKLYLADQADVTSFTKTTTVYSAVTMESAKVFKAYEFEQDSFEIKEVVTIENYCKKVVHTIEFDLAKMSDTMRTAVDEIATASACGVIAIAEDNNGTKWVIGYSDNMLKIRTLVLKSANATTGKKLSDSNKNVLTLESEDNELMRTFSGSVPLT